MTRLAIAVVLVASMAAAAQAQPPNPPPPGPPPAMAADPNATPGAAAANAVGRLPAEDLYLDLAVPESPAFAVLGFTPEKVVRPTSPRQVAANLLNGVDDRGNLQTGIALDFVPYLAWKGETLTIEEYRKDWLTRLASRAQFSLGTTKGTTDDESVRLGAGIRATLWDAGDPRDDDVFAQCLMRAHELVHSSLTEFLFAGEQATEVMKACALFGSNCVGDIGLVQDVLLLRERLAPRTAPPPPPGKLRDDLRREVAAKLGEDDFGRAWTARIVGFLDPEGQLMAAQRVTDECFADAKRRNWNDPSWEVGGALSWISADGQLGDLGSDGGGIWTSLALNLPDDTWWNLAGRESATTRSGDSLSDFVREHFQVILHARYRPDQRVPDQTAGTSATTIEEDVTLAGGRLRIGIPRAALSIEGAYTYTDPRGLPSDSSAFYSIGGEFQLAGDLWLQISVGSESGNDLGDDQTSVLGSIKYGFSSGSGPEVFQALQLLR